MYSVLFLGIAVAVTVCTGIYFHSQRHGVNYHKANRVLLFAMILLFIMLCLSVVPVFAAEPGDTNNMSSAAGIGFIAAAFTTATACIAAGIAVAYVGTAALGVLGEKPNLLGATLIYLGLAEGIAIYGVIVSLLILGKI